MGLIHAFAQQNRLILTASRLHGFTGQNLHVVPGFVLPGKPNGRKHQAVDTGAVCAHGKVIFVEEDTFEALFDQGGGKKNFVVLTVLKIIFVMPCHLVNAFAHNLDIRKIPGAVAMFGGMHQVRHLFGEIP